MDTTCKFCGKICKNENSLRNHQRLCKENPDRQESSFKKYNDERDYVPWNKGLDVSDPRVAKNGEKLSLKLKGRLGRKPTEEERSKISESMKLAHSEGRAWNIGRSRWNNDPSFPESFFMKVIENEFEDKNYIREYPFNNFSLDFASVDKQRCIEIDGDQHQRFQSYKDRDSRKDKMLQENGWTVLRISWSEMCKDTKQWIQVAKDFIS